MNSLYAAAIEFEITPEPEGVTDVRHGGKATEIASGLKTTVFLLACGDQRVCLVTTHFGPSFPINLSEMVRRELGTALGTGADCVLLFTSHNHTSVALANNGVLAYNAYEIPAPPVLLLPVGEDWLRRLQDTVATLNQNLEPVSVWWAVGNESRITYNRKGRRPDGRTYLMREEDREKLGDDFQGDVDFDAPILVLRNHAGRNVAVLIQYTGHPVTAFHPENTVVFGEWSQVACEIVGTRLGAPTGFLQGCAGDVNSKEMFTGGVERSRQFGEWLGRSYLDALNDLRESARSDFEISLQEASVPLGPLPAMEELRTELAEIEEFMRRAEAGDDDTMVCVGQNYSTGLSPAYRGWLASLIRPWNEWALQKRQSGEPVAVEQPMEIAALRLGDVGMVGLPCEPFQNIGRRIRAGSELPLTIPCGYMNVNHGYVPDSENVGDNEYMSAHYRYTKFRPPFRRPAGDALADAAVKLLNRFAQQHA